MEKQSSPQKGSLLPPDQLGRLVDYFLLLIEIDQKNKTKKTFNVKGATNAIQGISSNT